MKPRERDFLDDLGFKHSFLDNLHAKCYLNENQALLTSMNLYKYSQENNEEMGILVSREKDRKLYEEIHEEAMRLKRAASSGVKIAKSVKTVSAPTKSRTRRKPAMQKPKEGFCIRCKAVLPTNPEKPYCKNCYETWSRYKNPQYEENHCHTCGKDHKATLLKPLCSDCYTNYKASFKFASGKK